MTVINNLVSMDTLLSYHSMFDNLEQEDKDRYINIAYPFVANKLMLKPTLMSLDFGEGKEFSLIGDYIETDIGKVYYKEVFDIISTGEVDDTFISQAGKPALLFTIEAPTGKATLDGSYIKAQGIVNVLGYILPVYNENAVSPVLAFPMIAMMYSLMYRDRVEEGMASMYELLAIKYINIHNQNIINYNLTNTKVVYKAGAYGL